MISLGNSLKHYLDSPLKIKVAYYLHEHFMADYELSEVIDRLDAFHAMLETVPQGIDLTYTAVVDRFQDRLENEDYWEVFLVKKEDDSRYATYLAWIDCSEITDNSEELASFIRKDSGLIVSAGNIFGGNGNTFLRLNYACPKVLLQGGLKRLTRSIKSYQEL